MTKTDRRHGFSLAAPGTLILLVLVGWPAIQTAIYSFQDVDIAGGSNSFVGTENYANLFGSPDFRHSIVVTTMFTIGFTVICLCLGLAMALLLNEKYFLRGFARSLLIIPWASPWIVVGLMWKWFLDSNYGWLNGLLFQLGLIEEYKAFLSNEYSALFFVTLAASWRQASLSALVLLAGLQSLPTELHEAAKVDGAGAFRRLLHITLPWLKPTLFVITVINIIYGMLQFDVVYAMTNGGPGQATMLLSMQLYRELFVFTDIGAGSAVAIVMTAVAVLVGSLFAKTMAGSEDGGHRFGGTRQ